MGKAMSTMGKAWLSPECTGKAGKIPFFWEKLCCSIVKLSTLADDECVLFLWQGLGEEKRSEVS